MSSKMLSECLMSLKIRGISPYETINKYKITQLLGSLTDNTLKRIIGGELYGEMLRDIFVKCVTTTQMPFWDDKINDLLSDSNYLCSLIAKYKP